MVARSFRDQFFFGGRLFPGEHHHATFAVKTTTDTIDLQMESKDKRVAVKVCGSVSSTMPATSKFSSLEEASCFFEPGSVGFSVTKQPNRLDGLSLKTKHWKIEPFEVTHVYSSYFEDERVFPKGSVEFDCALLMRNIAHEWHSEPDLYV